MGSTCPDAVSGTMMVPIVKCGLAITSAIALVHRKTPST
ncbi:hypothetical protein PI125_g21359 [Phytophthora idaei]|nr:hypothetical protein PI125_g21359 [Phytophthora idaei]